MGTNMYAIPNYVRLYSRRMKTVDEVYISNTAVYKFCGAEILPSFSCYDVMKSPEIEAEFERIKDHMKQIVD